MAEPFEYAIKKDVRNNPIVREVDEARHRELWKSVALAAFLVLVLLFSAWQHFELLRHGYRVEQMQRERAAEEEAARHLRLEIDTLRSPQRIEALAIKQAAAGRAVERRGDRHRAGRAERPARIFGRGAAVAYAAPRPGLASDTQASPHRRRERARLLGARHRGEARLSADGPAARASSARREPAQSDTARLRRSAATSSTAAAMSWRRALTPIRSTPCRPSSRTKSRR